MEFAKIRDALVTGMLRKKSRQKAGVMPIRLLIADDSQFVRGPVARRLKEEPAVGLLGEAASSAEMPEMVAALKPDVLLLDVHMPDELKYSPAFVATELLAAAKRIVGMSLWNNDKTKALATSLGASALLDKCKLAEDLIPATRRADAAGNAART